MSMRVYIGIDMNNNKIIGFGGITGQKQERERERGNIFIHSIHIV